MRKFIILFVLSLSVTYAQQGWREGVRDSLNNRLGANWVTPQMYGAKGDGVTNDTDELRLMFASGANKFFFPSGTYVINMTEGDSLAYFNGESGIRIIGEGATIYNSFSSWTATNDFTNIFWFNNCNDIVVDGVNYDGVALTDFKTNVGYRGATFVYATTGTRNITVNAYLRHLRYGVHSGSYGTPALGNCSIFRGNIVADSVGYPLATYLADDIEMSINAIATHRTAYVAGCRHLRLNAKFKDEYIADSQVLLTDALVSPGVSKGISDAVVYATDMGSTTYKADSRAVGISLSRVDSGTTFSDIDITVNIVADDTTASTLGAFSINSSARVYQPSYLYNWEQYIYLRNIRLHGIVDRRRQTVQEPLVYGEIYIVTYDNNTNWGTTNDSTHYATISGLEISNFHYLPGTGAKPRGFYFFNKNIEGNVVFRNCDFGDNTPIVYRLTDLGDTASTFTSWYDVHMEASDSYYSTDPHKMTFINCKIDSALQSTVNKTFIATTVAGLDPNSSGGGITYGDNIRLSSYQTGAGTIGQLEFFNSRAYTDTLNAFIRVRRDEINDNGYIDFATRSRYAVEDTAQCHVRMTIDKNGDIQMYNDLEVDGDIFVNGVNVDSLQKVVYAFGITDVTSSSISIPMFNYSAITVSEARAVITSDGGANDSTAFNICWSTSIADGSPSTLFLSDQWVDNVTTGEYFNSFNDATIPANVWVWLRITTETGTVNIMGVTLKARND